MNKDTIESTLVMDMDNITTTNEPIVTIGLAEEVSALEFYQGYPYLLLAFYVVLFIALPSNIVTIVAYLKFDSLQTCTNMVIASQCFSDTLLLFLTQPYLWANFTEWGQQAMSRNKYGCLLALGMLTSSNVGSMVNIMSLATERLIAVCWALRYYDWVTEKRVKKFIMGMWTYMILVGIIPLFGLNTWTPGYQCLAKYQYRSLYTAVFMFLPIGMGLVVTAIFNIIIAVVAFKKNQITPPVIAGPSGASQNVAPSQDSSHKITKMLMTVVGVFYICLLPLAILTIMRMFPPASWHGNTPVWFMFAREASKILGSVNTAANPFIYGWKNEELRRAIKKLVGIKPNQVYPVPAIAHRVNNVHDTSV